MPLEAEGFRGLLLRDRGRTGLTQEQLAARVGVHVRSVQDWEAGVNYPSADRLRAIVATLLESGGLTPAHETEEAQALWSAVERASPRMHTPFDGAWFAALLDHAQTSRSETPPSEVETGPDWGEAPEVLGFVGRTDELSQLQGWVVDERCRTVAVVGMGGVGKTALVARLAQDVAARFERVYWRSLRDAPPPGMWLSGAIGFLSDQQSVPATGASDQVATLLRLLRARRCLVVLDNFETVFEPGMGDGSYRPGLAQYAHVVQAVADSSHQSCLVLTSREAPLELAASRGEAVRMLTLRGLSVREGQELLARAHLIGSNGQWRDLIERYGGNGLALKVVGDTITELFAGDIGAFLQETNTSGVFGGVRRLLSEQIERISALEQQTLRMLAIEREPVPLAELLAMLEPGVRRGPALQAVEALRRHSLAERTESGARAAFTLQSVVLEYVTDRLVEDVADEINRGECVLLAEHPLIRALAPDYVRQSQERLIGRPIVQRLQPGGAEQCLLALLHSWRVAPRPSHKYAPGNAVNLLRLQRGDLNGLDFSGLSIRQAYLADIDAHAASLAGSDLAESVLGEAFDFPCSVALSGDGALLAVGASTGEVWVWRFADRALVAALRGHTGVAWSVALSEAGHVLASGGEDGTVRIWDSIAGRALATLRGHTGLVRGVALSADGRIAASASLDGTVRLWDVASGRPLMVLRGDTAGQFCVALSADSRLLGAGDLEGTVRVWDTSSGTLVASLLGHSGVVRDVVLSADGRWLISGGADQTLRVWDTAGGGLQRILSGHPGGVFSLALSADGEVIASGDFEGTVRLWERRSGRPVATLPGHTGAVWGMALSADGRLLASGTGDASVRLWNASSRQPLATLQGHAGALWGLALAARGQLVASSGADEKVRLWDPGTGALQATLHGHTGAVWSVALAADGHLVVSGGEDGTVRLWSSESGRVLVTLRGHTGGVWGLALSSDCHLLASGGADGTVRVWEVEHGRLRSTLHGHTSMVWTVALSADGSLLASGSDDGEIRLWHTSTSDARSVLEGHSGAVWSVAVSADGRLLASGGEDSTVRVWDTVSGRQRAVYTEHASVVYSVALSADGRLLASGGGDGMLRLWDTNSGRPLMAQLAHSGVLRGLAMSADGQRVTSGGFDGALRVWDVGAGTLVRELRSARRYEGLDITDLAGITPAQREALVALGAVDRSV